MVPVTVNLGRFAEDFFRAKFNTEVALLAPLLENTNLVVTRLYPVLTQGFLQHFTNAIIRLFYHGLNLRVNSVFVSL